MKVKKIPMRCCVVTKERLPKYELIRVVHTPDNQVIVDLTLKANGRGAYLKKNIDIIEKAKKSKVLSKYLECDIPDKIYEELLDIVNKDN